MTISSVQIGEETDISVALAIGFGMGSAGSGRGKHDNGGEVGMEREVRPPRAAEVCARRNRTREAPYY